MAPTFLSPEEPNHYTTKGGVKSDQRDVEHYSLPVSIDPLSARLNFHVHVLHIFRLLSLLIHKQILVGMMPGIHVGI